MLNWLSTTPWRRLGEWSYSSTILNLDIRWKWVVSFTLRPPYPQIKSSRYPFDRILPGSQSRSGRCWVETHSGIEARPYTPPNFMIVKEHFMSWCRCWEAVNSFRFLLSPYSPLPASMCNIFLWLEKLGISQIYLLIHRFAIWQCLRILQYRNHTA